MREIHIDDLPALEGETLCTSPWERIDQARIDAFAGATGDTQWIHVDEARATAALGGTIAHGFLTLSLIPGLRDPNLRFTGTARMINYGLDKVRFPEPVPTGARLRLVLVHAGTERLASGLRLTADATLELENAARPACVARTLTLLIPA